MRRHPIRYKNGGQKKIPLKGIDQVCNKCIASGISVKYGNGFRPQPIQPALHDQPKHPMHPTAWAVSSAQVFLQLWISLRNVHSFLICRRFILILITSTRSGSDLVLVLVILMAPSLPKAVLTSPTRHRYRSRRMSWPRNQWSMAMPTSRGSISHSEFMNC